MKDTCSITRDTGTTTNPNTGAVTKNTADIYTGKCRVQIRLAVVRRRNAGETQVTQTRPELMVPISVLGLRTGDVATITVVDPIAGDVDLIGRVLRIEAPIHKSNATARRMGCTEGGVDA